MHTYDVTVYSQPHCQPCRLTKRKLEAAGVPYTEKDAVAADNHRYITGRLGHMAAPVVTVHRDGQLWTHWSGLRAELLGDVIATIKAQEAAA